MENIINYIKWGIVSLGTLFTWIFGAWDIPLITLLVFIFLDYLTGIIKVCKNKELCSNIGLKGIAKKGLILIVLLVAVMLDRLLGNGTWMFRTMIAYFYITNEGISILENCAALGVPIPEKLKQALKQLNNKK
ncbi:phage holin family protein [Clostridium perfringens]|uniref:phage holin family protein n=1 Tax=Clostridium perfringens TaxID=1502 RepID=UPI0024697FE5|nr:phage holin family protein [Clostridium perfringens]MDH5092506.1 Holin family protein [Clostridium perfringens]